MFVYCLVDSNFFVVRQVKREKNCSPAIANEKTQVNLLHNL